MADSALSSLTETTTLADSDLFYVVDGANSRKVTFATLGSYLASGGFDALSLSAATGNEVAFTLAYTTNKATSGNDTGLLISMTDTASPGTSKPFDIQVGGSSKFYVTESGDLHGGNGSSAIFNIYAGDTQVLIGYGSGYGAQALRVCASGGLALGSGADLILVRDAADTLAQRRGTNAQAFNHYGYYSSATRYTRGGVKHSQTTLSSVSGATVTASNLRPAGAFVVGVATTVITGIGTSNGTTGYNVGDGSDADRYGAITGTAAGTDSDNSDAVADPTEFLTAAGDIVLTAVGGNFDGTGDIVVDVFYLTTEAD